MAKINALVHSMSTGEVSVAALARIDQEKLRLATEVQENILPRVIGSGQFRPGTGYLGPTASNNQARLLPFIKAVDDAAVLELTDAKLKVWVADALVTRPSVTSSISDGTFSISNDDLFDAATVTSSTLGSGSVANLEDEDTTTVAVWNAAATGTLTADFGSAKTITAFWLTADSTPARAPNAFTLAGSATGAFAGEQTTVYTASGLADWVSREPRQFTVTSPGSYRYYRLSMTNTQSGTGDYRLSEVSFFDSSWIAVTTGYATATIAGGTLTLAAPNRGGSGAIKQQVSTSSAGTEHALRIEVTRGPVIFECGSTDGDDDYVTRTELDTGTHSLAFTPSGSYWIRFTSRIERQVVVDSVAVESSGVMEIAAPWTTAQLRQIRVDQSGDIVFLAHRSWQQRKIERRATRSWSLVKYYADDGPFAVNTISDDNVALTVAQAYGNTTLTASAPVFKSTDVGSLYRTLPGGFDATFALGAADAFTEVIRIFGDVVFDVVITGTWAGTLTLQRSTVSDDGPWDDTSTTYTASGTTTFSPGTAFDNIEQWYRLGFKTDGFTSGVANVRLAYDGSSGSGKNDNSFLGRAGIFRVTAYASALSVSVEVLQSPTSIIANKNWRRGAWSDRKGWPSAVVFFDGRLWWAREDAYWGSESDDFTAFNLDAEGDAGSIQRSIATGGSINQTQWMMSLQRLMFGTTGAESSARASTFDEPLTPTNISVKDASTQGSAAVSPVKIDGRGVFVQRSGKKLFQILYSFEANDYVSSDLNKLNEDIGAGGFVELAVQRQPAPYIWAVRADGEVPILLYDLTENITGWFPFVSDGASGQVESVCVLPGTAEDAVYLAIKRTISGGTVRYIEKLAMFSEAIGGSSSKMADSGTLTAGPVSSVTLAHLASQTGLVGWGTKSSVAQPITGLSANGSGVIQLGDTYSNVWVGLPYTGRYKSAKLAYGAQGGTALLQKKIITQLGLLMSNVHVNAITYGADFTTMYAMPRVERGTTVSETAVNAVYDEPTLTFPGGWDTDSRLCLKMSAPYPATINGIVIGIQTNEKA